MPVSCRRIGLFYYLRLRLLIERHRYHELCIEAEGRYADGFTHRRMVEVGSRINVLQDRLAMLNECDCEAHP